MKTIAKETNVTTIIKIYVQNRVEFYTELYISCKKQCSCTYKYI